MQREEIEVNIRGDLSSDAYRAFLQDPRFRVIGGQSTIIRGVEHPTMPSRTSGTYASDRPWCTPWTDRS